MKRSTLIVTAIGLLALATTARFALVQTTASTKGSHGTSISAPANQDTENLTGAIKQLTVELKALRLELLEQRLDQQEEKIAQLEHELRQLGIQRARLQDQEQAMAREMAELDEELRQATTEPERIELQKEQAELAGSGLTRLRTEQRAMAEREADLKKLLERERQRRAELQEKIKGLKAQLEK